MQERLLTGIAVFGPELARQLIQGGATAVLGTARIVVLPAMEDLASDPRARRRCWALLREARMAECP